MIPSFSRIEIRLSDRADLAKAATQLSALAGELRRIADSVEDEKLMRLAAHQATRETIGKLRGGQK